MEGGSEKSQSSMFEEELENAILGRAAEPEEEDEDTEEGGDESEDGSDQDDEERP